MKDNVFIDARVITRGGDELSSHRYTTGEIVKRIWREHLRPHVFLLVCSTIAMLLLLSSSEPGRLAEWSIALLLAWIGTTVLLIASPVLLKVFGTRGSRALERLMGMILVILATQMLLNGIRDFVNSL